MSVLRRRKRRDNRLSVLYLKSYADSVGCEVSLTDRAYVLTRAGLVYECDTIAAALAYLRSIENQEQGD